MREIWENMRRCMDQGVDCALVSAVGGHGSVPRKDSAHMLVTANGRVCGTVGGGAVEAHGIALAQRKIAAKANALESFALHHQAAQDIGMICGGEVMLHVCCIAAGDEEKRHVAEQALDLLARGENAWLLIGLSDASLTVTAQHEHGGVALPHGASQLEIDGAAIYAEQIVSSSRVYIFGGGHVAQALVPVLHSVDFRCVVIEDRPEFCSRTLFEKAESLLLLRREEWESALRIGKEDYVCIMTRGHRGDLACQAFAMRTKASYIGVIGSRRKIEAVNSQLREMGFPDEALSRIYTPIGLEIGAVTPSEIAVSIAAQMIACRAQMRGNIKRICMA